MELSCDEKVIKEMGNEIKKDYSHSLLSISSDKKIIGNSPLAFGGGNTKSRIKNILDYKKPRFWASMLGFIVIIVSVIGLLTNPKPRGIIEEEEMLVKEFIENYYGQLAYTKEEQEIVKEEIDEIIGHGKVTREESFYYYYEQVLAPELYQRMVSNRWIPNLYMVEIGDFILSNPKDS